MKIIHYIPSIDQTDGGTTTYMQLLASELGKLCELHIVTHRSDAPVEMMNSQVHYIGRSVLWGMKKEWGKILNDLQPDIVHINCCWMPQSAYAQKWAQDLEYKVVLTPHGMLEPWIIQRNYWWKKLPALWLYQKKAVQRANYLHATAESEKENLLKLGYNPHIAVIPNGIEVNKIRMKESWKRNREILFLSRIHVKKGIELLLEAVAQLKEELKGYRVLIAGEGDETYIQALKLNVHALNISDQVQLIGGVYGAEKWKRFQQADLFVLPSYSENFGIVVAEALASGTPVLTTQGTPWQELETQNCGWWIELSVDEIVKALRAFINTSETTLEVMGKNGRQLVEEKYSIEAVAHQMKELYEWIVCLKDKPQYIHVL
ncbi:MAG: glycosyltransferase [Bacteroidaceae bacterium]|nr:glycosyltransferase [Bacteroidaceae bacterium]